MTHDKAHTFAKMTTGDLWFLERDQRAWDAGRHLSPYVYLHAAEYDWLVACGTMMGEHIVRVEDRQ